jgi:transcriptional regulator with XRE-family HTH domain
MDHRGYSARIIEANNAADDASLGVQLGRYCISRDISAIEIANQFGVSKVAVYKWFTNEWEPRQQHRERIVAILDGRGVSIEQE